VAAPRLPARRRGALLEPRPRRRAGSARWPWHRVPLAGQQIFAGVGHQRLAGPCAAVHDPVLRHSRRAGDLVAAAGARRLAPNLVGPPSMLGPRPCRERRRIHRSPPGSANPCRGGWRSMPSGKLVGPNSRRQRETLPAARASGPLHPEPDHLWRGWARSDQVAEAMTCPRAGLTPRAAPAERLQLGNRVIGRAPQPDIGARTPQWQPVRVLGEAERILSRWGCVVVHRISRRRALPLADPALPPEAPGLCPPTETWHSALTGGMRLVYDSRRNRAGSPASKPRPYLGRLEPR